MARPVFRAAIVGCGQIAGGYDLGAGPEMIRTHVRAYQQNAEVELTSVADVAPEQARTFASQWGIPRSYGSLAELLEAEKPDLVSICTPDVQHERDLRDCLASDSVRAIWCEKPLTLDPAVAGDLVELARKRNVKLAVNYQRQWEASHRRIAAEIRAGTWGRVLGGQAAYAKGIFHNGSHLIALLRGLLGEPETMKVHGALADYGTGDPTVDATLIFGGAPVRLAGLPIPPYAVFELSLFCQNGTIRMIDSGKTIVRQRFSSSGPQLLDPEIEPTGLDRVLGTVLENIVHSLRDGSPLVVDGDSALRTLEICSELNRQVSRL